MTSERERILEDMVSVIKEIQKKGTTMENMGRLFMLKERAEKELRTVI